MYLLDTNVISEMRNASRRHPKVSEWLSGQVAGDLYVSVMTMRELYYGAYRLKETRPELRIELLNWIENIVIPGFGPRILSIDIETVRCHAELNLPNSNVSVDAMLAATALGRGLIVVTRNTKDFSGFGVRTVNPWEYSR